MAKISVTKRKQDNLDAGKSATGGGGGASFFATKPGTVRMVPRTWDLFLTSGKGTPALGITFIIIAGGSEVGKIVSRDFYLSEAALPMLADFAIAMGYEDEIDTDNTDTIKAMLKSGTRSVLSTLKLKDGTGDRKLLEPSFFFLQDDDTPPELKVKDFADVKALLEKCNAKEVMEKYAAFREKHPRKVWDPSKGEPPASGGGGGGGGERDDDIPF